MLDFIYIFQQLVVLLCYMFFFLAIVMLPFKFIYSFLSMFTNATNI